MSDRAPLWYIVKYTCGKSAFYTEFKSKEKAIEYSEKLKKASKQFKYIKIRCSLLEVKEVEE
jgi:predicted GIY-YIG superfamily endonuclease